MLTELLEHGWASTPERLALAAAITLVFAILARVVRGVTLSGAVAGGLACLALFVGAGPAGFALLCTLFVMTWLATRAGYSRKQELGVAERRDGRNAWQVSANLAAAAACSAGYAGTGRRLWLMATVAALAEAATDTIASEIGQAWASEARMITTWARVPAGTDGGVTIVGTLAGAAAGVVTVGIAVLGGLTRPNEAWIPVAAGFAGMLFDSLLGATIQRLGWLSNRGVNFVATATAATLGAAGAAYLLAV